MRRTFACACGAAMHLHGRRDVAMKELEKVWEEQHDGEDHWPVSAQDAWRIRHGGRVKREGQQVPRCQHLNCERPADEKVIFPNGGFAWFCAQHGSLS